MESFFRINWTCQKSTTGRGNDIRAVPVDVVDSGLRFQAAGVNPKKHKRTPLLVVDNLEGQSAQVILVPTPGERKSEKKINLFMCSGI